MAGDLPVLVTGASGFIGRRLVAKLRAQGERVRALVMPGESPPEPWATAAVDAPPVEIARGDITRAAEVDGAAEGVSTVFHLAAVVGDWGDEALFQRVTVEGTRHVLDAAVRGAARVVLASSIVVYGDGLARQECHEDAPLGEALGPYSRAKQAQERLAFEAARARGLPVVALRFANVFGVGSGPWVDEALRLLALRLPTLIGDGEQNAGLCHVDHAVDAMLLAASSPRHPRAYNVNDGSSVTWRRYFSDLAALAGKSPPRSLPAGAARIAARLMEPVWRAARATSRPPLTREALNLVGSNLRLPIERARSELGFAPHVAYADALEEIRASLG